MIYNIAVTVMGSLFADLLISRVHCTVHHVVIKSTKFTKPLLWPTVKFIEVGQLTMILVVPEILKNRCKFVLQLMILILLPALPGGSIHRHRIVTERRLYCIIDGSLPELILP